MAISSALGIGSAAPGVCTSSTRPTSPFEGQMIYETDTNRVLVWDNSAWVMIADTDQPPSLQLIETKDVTTAGVVDFENVFSSSYANYLLMWSYLQNTSDASLFLQFRDSGGVVSTGYRHGYGGNYTSSGTPLFAGFSFQTTDTTSSFCGSSASASNRTSGYLQLMNPAASTICYGNGQSSGLAVSATLFNTYLTGGIVHNTSTTRTGIRLFPNAGTVTGKFTLYGYRN